MREERRREKRRVSSSESQARSRHDEALPLPFVPRDPVTLISEKPRMRHTSGRDSGEDRGERSSGMLPETGEVEIVDATDR